MSLSMGVDRILRVKPIFRTVRRFDSLWMKCLQVSRGVPNQSRFLVPRGKHTYGADPEIIGQECYIERFIIGSKIGSFCSLAPGLQFLFLGKHRSDWVSTYPFHTLYADWKIDAEPYHGGKPILEKIDPDPIIIGNDVWIASDVSIKQGVTIGDGAVIAMRSLVTKDVPPYTLVGGNPAKVIRTRFSKEQIESLLKIKWWNWDDDQIRKIAPLLLSEDVDKFIIAAEKIMRDQS